MLGWKVRAALRAGQWKEVAPAINAMSEDDPGSTRPGSTGRAARWPASAATSAAPRPATSTRRIAGSRGFYELLALEELGQRTVVPTRPAPLTPEEKAAARANPGLARALLCHRDRPAARGRARVELRHQPARQGRHGRPRAAGRRRLRLPARGVGPLHQHQRAHQGRDRRRAALSRCPSTTRCCARARTSASTRPTSTA